MPTNIRLTLHPDAQEVTLADSLIEQFCQQRLVGSTVSYSVKEDGRSIVGGATVVAAHWEPLFSQLTIEIESPV